MTKGYDPSQLEKLLRRAHEVAVMVEEFRSECDFGRWLRRERRARDLTLREVAGATGYSIGYISDVERGRRSASPGLAPGIADSFDMQLFEVEARIWVGRMAAIMEQAAQ